MIFEFRDAVWLVPLVFSAPVLGLWLIYKITGAGNA